MQLDRAKGTRDFGPEEMILRLKVVDIIRKVFENYGFSPFETPILERFDVLTAKFAAGTGTDVMKEIFQLSDQGKRKLGLKFDQTVPLARYIAMNPTIKLPFKRYTIDRAFRDGPIKLGRYREFYQCDCDIVGSSKPLADAEILMLAQAVFAELGMKVTIEVNSRKIITAILNSFSVDSEKQNDVIIIIDKVKKAKREELEAELTALGLTKEDSKKLLDVFATTGENYSDVAAKLRDIVKSDEMEESLAEIESIMSFIPDESNVIFSPALARGLNYYTGTVFEAFLVNSEITSSVAGGGRYDNMIGGYCNKEFPAIGIAFGLAPIMEALKIQEAAEGKEPQKTITEAFVIPIKQPAKGIEVVEGLRREGINAEIDINMRGLSKNLKYANYYNIPYILIIGEEEAEQNKVKLRNMSSGEESLVDLPAAIDIIKTK